MKLKTRPVMIATAALTSLAAALIIWQVAKSPTTAPGKTSTTTTHIGSASGLVTQAPSSPQAATQRSAAASNSPNVAAPSTAEKTATAPAAIAAGSPSANTSANTSTSSSTSSTTTTIKHRVVPRTDAQPPILPNEVNTAVAKAIGSKTSLMRLFYLEPLARRFVASVDGLGNKTAPNELWLLKPAPGDIKLVPSSKQPGTQLIKRDNPQRYAHFVQWIIRTDNAQLLSLYGRMYPLLQQTYLDLGHPDGYFNDRVIEVIDLMLATPIAKPPLRVQAARADRQPAKASATGPQRSRYEFSDPALESLATGQKLLLRMGTQNAALLKPKLKALRSGLIKLGQQQPKRG